MKKLFLLAGFVFIATSMALAAADTPPSFAEFKSQFDMGVTMSPDTLKGTWKFVGFAMAGKCPLQGDPYACNRQDMNGLKDKDGLDMDTLIFADGKVSVSNIVGPESAQGPITVRATEPQFAFLSYDENKNVMSDAIMAASCRSVAGSTNLMLCQEIYFDNHSTPGNLQIRDQVVLKYKKVE